MSISNELNSPKPTSVIHDRGIFRSPENWRLGCLILSAGAIRCILAIHSAANGLFDDAYASLRYASNLAHGQGFVFNPGERVLGTTSPLHAFLLAALGKVFGITHLVAITVILGLFASLGLLYCSERLLRRVGIPVEVKWTYLCVLAFLPSFLANTSSGMETPLVLFLMSVSIYLAVQDRLTALAIVGILLFLARVDTGLWLLALGGHILLMKGRPLRRLAVPLVIFLSGVISWLVFSRLYFGSIVPESIVGKAMNHGAFDPSRLELCSFDLVGVCSRASIRCVGIHCYRYCSSPHDPKHRGAVESISRFATDDILRAAVRSCFPLRSSSPILLVPNSSKVGVLSCRSVFRVVVGCARFEPAASAHPTGRWPWPLFHFA